MMGVFIPLLIISFGFVAFFAYRRMRNQRSHSTYRYDELNNDNLDEDEIEFKRMIESNHGSTDPEDEDIEAMFGEDSGHDDFSFSAKDKDRLNMLEKLRSNLVANAENKEESQGSPPSAPPRSPKFAHEDSDDEENMRL